MTIPEDVNHDLLDGMLQELPTHAEEFSAAIQRLIAGGTLEDVQIAQRISHTIKGAGNTVGITASPTSLTISKTSCLRSPAPSPCRRGRWRKRS